MRFAVLGLAVVAGLVIVGSAVGQRREVPGERTGPRATTDRAIPSSELIALNSENSDGNQQVVLIDPKSHVMSVYHVARSSGTISLKSVRNVHWDLQMDEFNSGTPSPQEIRAMLDSR